MRCSKIYKIVYEVFEINVKKSSCGKILLKGKQTDGKRGLEGQLQKEQRITFKEEQTINTTRPCYQIIEEIKAFCDQFTQNLLTKLCATLAQAIEKQQILLD